MVTLLDSSPYADCVDGLLMAMDEVRLQFRCWQSFASCIGDTCEHGCGPLDCVGAQGIVQRVVVERR